MTSYRQLFSMEGKTAVVTGGAGLIGSEIVAAFCEFGATVYIADTSRDQSEALMTRTGARYLKLDITSEESIAAALAELSSLDIMVNCAYPRTADWGTKLEEVPFDSWKTNLDSHLGGYFLCCRQAAELMKRRGGGSIINIASIYGVVAPDFSLYEGTSMTMPVAYAAIKGGVIALTRYLATYYGGDKVRANVVSPGGVFDGQSKTFVDKYSQKTPMGRMGTPEEIAGAAVYLASNASSYVTGQNIVVDGGWTAW